MAAKERNDLVDALRGIAMLMVIMGHTMTGCTDGAESTLLFNVIWSIQMPLFFLISGYVTKYMQIPSEADDLLKLLCKRTRTYLLPWGVWTFLIRGIILGEKQYLNMPYLLWNMDSGYWFLFSLWTISIIFSIALYFSGKLKSIQRFMCCWGIYIIGMALLLWVAIKMGLSFLCIKLTLYYMPFFAVGVLFAQTEAKLFCTAKGRLACKYTAWLCMILYVILLTRHNLYMIEDDLRGIMIRACASVCGCVYLTTLCSEVLMDRTASRVLQWVGKNSLGIYLSHYLLLCLVQPNNVPAMESLEGITLVTLNFAITSLLAALVTNLFDRNWFIRRICLGK